ncbi:MAG: tetratricopeptide repeat protein [Planctomycetota bacterium]|jgi:tetratricopeptide (TPR) repeat protein
MSDNNNIQNEQEQPSNAPSERKVKQVGVKSLKEWSAEAWKKYRGIIAIVGPCIAGIFAFWEGFGQWWFGFPVPFWIYFVLATVILVIWVVAFCGYYGEAHPERMPAQKKKEQEEKGKLRCLSINMFVMIAIPVLLLGVLGGNLAINWRLTEKIVILVEPFEGDEEKPYYLARAVKSGIERNIRLSDRHCIKVVLGKSHKDKSIKEVPLDERALKYRADMVISGWCTKRNSEFLIGTNFHVVRLPQGLPAVFRRQESDYPLSMIFDNKEIENFRVHFTLGGLLEYDSILIIGAGAYASGKWDMAEHYFRKALDLIKKGQVCTSSDQNRVSQYFPYYARKIVEQRRKKVYSEEYIEGDKALLKLYIGHCLFNQGRLDCAIDYYHEAVKQGEEIPESDMRYSEILTNAYMGRGIAYREKNEFDLAAHDFKKLAGHSLFSDGFEPRRTYESRYPVKGSVGLKVYTKRFYERGEKYLKSRAHPHAQSELETSVKMLRALSNEAFTNKLEQECSFLLAKSLVRLGEVHSRQALPETWNEKHTNSAIKYLNEASNIIEELKQDEADVNDVFDEHDLKELHADCLRHLGDVHRLMDRIDDVNDANDYHGKARDLWTMVKCIAGLTILIQTQFGWKRP